LGAAFLDLFTRSEAGHSSSYFSRTRSIRCTSTWNQRYLSDERVLDTKQYKLLILQMRPQSHKEETGPTVQGWLGIESGFKPRTPEP
jgi:hypothetical protein